MDTVNNTDTNNKTHIYRKFEARVSDLNVILKDDQVLYLT